MFTKKFSCSLILDKYKRLTTSAFLCFVCQCAGVPLGHCLLTLERVVTDEDAIEEFHYMIGVGGAVDDDFICRYFAELFSCVGLDHRSSWCAHRVLL